MAEGDRIDDREVWKRCNSGHPARISMTYMEREFLALGPEQFAKERLGKSNWPADETGRYAVISREKWEACTDPAARPGDPVTFGVAVSRDGRWETASDWTATYEGTAHVIGAVPMKPQDIDRLLIRTPDGRTLLTMPS